MADTNDLVLPQEMQKQERTETTQDSETMMASKTSGISWWEVTPFVAKYARLNFRSVQMPLTEEYQSMAGNLVTFSSVYKTVLLRP